MVTPSRHRLHPGKRVRAVVVDDSALYRHLVARTLERDPGIEVVATAPNGAIALDQIAKLRPDVVSLDIEMPEMDGLETLRRIRRHFPDTRVVMLSAHTERGASATFEALSLGADDYIAKTCSNDSSAGGLQDLLLPKIKQFFSFPKIPSNAESGKPETLAPPRIQKLQCLSTVKLIAIGVSTGGPEALNTLLGAFPADFSLPVLIVQHMPRLFTHFLCERLRGKSVLDVREGQHGDPLTGGKVFIAPGDFHMRVVSAGGEPAIHLDQGPLECSCRPSVDALFNSAADLYGSGVLAVVLTGMGQDGLRGATVLKERGASILVQDEASSAVWGMPRAVAEAGLADSVLPLPAIVPEIVRIVAGGRPAGLVAG